MLAATWTSAADKACMITLRGERKMTTLMAGRVSLAAVSLVISLTIPEALRAQSTRAVGEVFSL
jgi:hypothetical protein